MLEKIFGPKCQHCGQHLQDGHHCEEMQKLEDEIGADLAAGLAKAKALMEKPPKPSIFSSDEKGKICLERDPKAE